MGMDISTNQINIIIIFLICIIIITLLYINYDKLPKLSSLYSYEKFEDIVGANDNKINIISDSELPNLLAKNAINTQINTFEKIFDKYAILDPSIIVNNNGLPCDSWSNYKNENLDNPTDEYNTTNHCKIVQGSESNDPQCVVDNVLTSCKIFYSDGYINKLSSIDIKKLKNTMRDNIIRNCKTQLNNIDTQNTKIDSILNLLIEKLDLEKQQLYFINYNKTNLDDKQKLVNITSKEFEKQENDINVNQINFSNFLSKNNTNDSKINLYYNIIIYLIIAIIVIGILNLLVSEMS